MFRPDPKPEKKEKEQKQLSRKPRKRKCIECGEKFQPVRVGQKACSPGCAISHAKKEQAKQEKKERRKKLKNLRGKGQWKQDLQVVINAICRELDKDLDCISHPDMKGFLRYDAGHAYTVKAHEDIRYNLHNIHKQNSQANERHGFGPEYANGLINRYGQEYFEMVMELPLEWKHKGKEFTILNIREKFLPNAKQVLKRLKSGEQLTRDQCNELIGIYVAK